MCTKAIFYCCEFVETMIHTYDTYIEIGVSSKSDSCNERDLFKKENAKNTKQNKTKKKNNLLSITVFGGAIITHDEVRLTLFQLTLAVLSLDKHPCAVWANVQVSR